MPGVAVIEVPVLQRCGEREGDYTIVLSCHMNASGLDKDRRFVLEVQANRAQKAQLDNFTTKETAPGHPAKACRFKLLKPLRGAKLALVPIWKESTVRWFGAPCLNEN